MEFLLPRLNKLIIGLLFLSIPVSAYVPKIENHYIPNVNQRHLAQFQQGHFAPYSEHYIRRTIVGKARIMSNGAIIQLPYGPKFVPTFHDLQHKPKFQERAPQFSVNDVNLDLDMSSPDFYWNEREKRYIDIFFWTTQILDVYSTYKGMKYDCVFEANPLLPEVPKVHEMIGLKIGVIGGIKFVLDADELFWYGWKLGAGVSTGVVVANNFRLLNKAERQCEKR
jgi:hypothetical protein